MVIRSVKKVRHIHSNPVAQPIHFSIGPAITTIACLLSSNSSFLITRVGLGDETTLGYCYTMHKDLSSCTIAQNKKYQIDSSAPSNSGVYGKPNWLINGFGKLYAKAIWSANIHARFNHLEVTTPALSRNTRRKGGCNHFCEQDELLHAGGFQMNQYAKFLDPKTCASPSLIHHRALEPWMYAYPKSASWTTMLAHRRVLLVSPFPKTIQMQFARCDKVWGKDAIYLCPQGMEITIVKSPYTFASNRSIPWKQHLYDMQRRIYSENFHVAFLSCGGFGLPLAHFIKKNMNKSAIYIGGGMQLWFGILGGRWLKNPYISPYINQYWIRPIASETPERRIANAIEASTYWRR